MVKHCKNITKFESLIAASDESELSELESVISESRDNVNISSVDSTTTTRHFHQGESIFAKYSPNILLFCHNPSPSPSKSESKVQVKSPSQVQV